MLNKRGDLSHEYFKGMSPIDKEADIMNEVWEEFNRATSINGSFNSPHEGYAVILEELDEL